MTHHQAVLLDTLLWACRSPVSGAIVVSYTALQKQGIWVFRLNRAELAASVEAATELLQCGEDSSGAVARLLGHRSIAGSQIFQGAFTEARRHAALVLAAHAEMPRDFNSPANEIMIDAPVSPPVGGLRSLLSWAMLLQGDVDQAFLERRQADIAGSKSNLSHARAVILHQSCVFHQLVGNLHELDRQSGALVALTTEHGFAHWLATGTIFRGWCAAIRGDREAGVAEMRRGLETKRAAGARLKVPYYLGLIASLLTETAPQEAMSLLADALARVERTGERWFEAELHRLKGEVVLSASNPVANEAELCFQQALAVAREQGAKLWELRTAMSLARLWREQGRRKEVNDLLVPGYHWFTEGFDTSDLKEAQALIRELA